MATATATATSGFNFVRIRVYFDYPPPALTDCRMCWVLVDLNKCRVVADLASIIRDKFDFSRRTILNLFLEECYLPPTESVYVVRDNDSIRVKVEVLPQVNGCEPSTHMEEGTVHTRRRKRQRERGSEEEEEAIVKKTSRREKLQEAASVKADEDEEKMKKKKRKKKRKRKQGGSSALTRAEKDSVASVCNRGSVSASPVSWEAELQKGPAVSSGSSGRGGKDAPSQAGGTKPRPQQSAISSGPHRASSPTTGSSSDSSCGASTSAPARPNSLPPNAAPVSTSSAAVATQADGSSSDSSSDTELVIKRPLPGAHMGLGRGAPGWAGRGVGRGGASNGGRGVGRGVGRGNSWTPRRGGGPRGGGRGGQREMTGAPGQINAHVVGQNSEQQKHLEDTLTNRTVLLQNPPDSAPPRNYTAMPLLAAPPAVGQIVAFKLLELTENYTPEVSEYKEAKIIGFNQSTNQIELELLSSTPAPAEPGKFDLVYQAPDGSEVIEYAVSRGARLTERWESLLEPRLVVENTG